VLSRRHWASDLSVPDGGGSGRRFLFFYVMVVGLEGSQPDVQRPRSTQIGRDKLPNHLTLHRLAQ
jgi:hypothetical protein